MCIRDRLKPYGAGQPGKLKRNGAGQSGEPWQDGRGLSGQHPPDGAGLSGAFDGDGAGEMCIRDRMCISRRTRRSRFLKSVSFSECQSEDLMNG